MCKCVPNFYMPFLNLRPVTGGMGFFHIACTVLMLHLLTAEGASGWQTFFDI